MQRFFDPCPSLLNPGDIVPVFTKSSAEELRLPARAIVVVDGGNLNLLVRETSAVRIPAWSPYRSIYQIPGRGTVLTRSAFGGANMAALVEEISWFGIREVCFWGYCGGVAEHLSIGEKILAERALREEGTSYHYLPEEDSFVSSGWFSTWQAVCGDEGFVAGPIWTCDAPYRESSKKVAQYRDSGILGVEMEVASFYAVCTYRGLKGIAFLIVSDLLRESGWTPGFFSPSFKSSVQEMVGFMLNRVV